MITFEQLSTLACSFPEVEVQPHFERTSFRVKKKIFATYDDKKNSATLKLSEIDQSVFATADTHIYPVDNALGKQGWTIVELNEVRESVFKDALKSAYCTVAPEKLKKELL